MDTNTMRAELAADLLAALKECEKIFRFHVPSVLLVVSPEYARLRAVITKAEGVLS